MKGEQITKPRLAYPGEKTGLARQVRPGKEQWQYSLMRIKQLVS